jgi:hypothetical protein
MERKPKIDPVLKRWIDRVFVPVMVRDYLASARIPADNNVEPNPAEASAKPESERPS